MSLLNSVLQSLRKSSEKAKPDVILDLQLTTYNLQLGFQSGDNYFEQSPRPEGFDPSSLRARFAGGYTVKLKKGVKRITLFRFLLAKLLYDSDEEGLHLDEFAVMVNLFYDLLEESDPTFVEKYRENLNRLVPLFADLGKARNFPLRLYVKDRPYSDLINYVGPILPTQNSYYGLRGNRDLRMSFYISFNDTLRPQQFRAPRFVGVGYRDKGTRRDNALDGSPSWQEVGSEAAALEEALGQTYVNTFLEELEEVKKVHTSSPSRSEE
jgi:hypothetical protein